MDHEHREGQKCFFCDVGIEKLKTWEDEHFKKSGFYMHFVSGEHFINAHTHGFDRSWGHLDFQLIFPVSQKVVGSIFWSFADRVKAGERFEAGTSVDEIIEDFPVRLSSAKEGGRDVLRVILPDKNGKFPGDEGVDEVFGHQIDHVDEYDDSPPDPQLN